MKWPWVRRTRLELAEMVLDSARELEQEQRTRVAEAREQYLECQRRYIEMERGLTRDRDRLHDLLGQSQEFVRDYWTQIQVLVKLIVELKKVGFEQPVNPADITTDAPLPGAVEEAIDQRASEGTELHRALQKYARAAMRAEGATTESVAAQIIKGASEEVFELL